MKILRNFWNVFILACSAAVALAQTPPAEQLLPEDTIAVMTVPEWGKLSAFYEQSSWGQFWADPAMKPFKDKFMTRFNEDLAAPLERELSVKLGDYKELLQGQLTFALMPPKEGTDQFFSVLAILDAKDKSEALTARLDEIKKKWSDSGKEVRTEKIRDIEFNVVDFTQGDLSSFLKKAFPGEEEEGEPAEADSQEKTQLYIGQSKSLLVAGENPKAIEKILARQAGGEVPPLAEQPAFVKSQNLILRDSLGFAWLNFKPIYSHILKMAAKEQQTPPPGMPQFELQKVLPALGFAGLESVAIKLGGNADGSAVEAFLNVPESSREGIFKLMTIQNKDAAPPAFVPADVIKFQRVRVDAAKGWATLESMLNAISPQIGGFLQMMFSTVEAAGKQLNPDFSFKRNFIDNLGDDFIIYQKAPKEVTAAALASPPQLFLIGSPNPAQLVEALRVVSMLSPAGGPPKEREFLGKKIYSVAIPTAPPPGEDPEAAETPEPVAPSLSFTSSAGYVALTTDNSVLEEYLRSGEGTVKPLRDLPGFVQASEKAGGMGNGMLNYENQAESMRVAFEVLKADPDGAQGLTFLNVARGGADVESVKDWFDLTLLPSFDQVSKYFHIAVVSGGTTSDGWIIRGNTPTPPALKK